MDYSAIDYNTFQRVLLETSEKEVAAIMNHDSILGKILSENLSPVGRAHVESFRFKKVSDDEAKLIIENFNKKLIKYDPIEKMQNADFDERLKNLPNYPTREENEAALDKMFYEFNEKWKDI